MILIVDSCLLVESGYWSGMGTKKPFADGSWAYRALLPSYVAGFGGDRKLVNQIANDVFVDAAFSLLDWRICFSHDGAEMSVRVYLPRHLSRRDSHLGLAYSSAGGNGDAYSCRLCSASRRHPQLFVIFVCDHLISRPRHPRPVSSSAPFRLPPHHMPFRSLHSVVSTLPPVPPSS